MITFFPGPSKVYPEVQTYFQDAYNQGLLSANHRSSEFTVISKRAVDLIKEKLNVPADYTVYFTSSATEGWEILAQSLTKKYSHHIFNGAFGKKWFENVGKLGKTTAKFEFGIDTELDLTDLEISSQTDVICITQNETSNGTQVKNDKIAAIKAAYTDQLIAVDATSSLAGVDLQFANADIWIGSVQKCFGLPAGLGLLICSPRAMRKAVEINENNHYNSLLFIEENMKGWQTNYTPNVLDIYFLMRVLEKVENISVTAKKLQQRAKVMYDFLDGFNDIRSLVQNPNVQSDTVVAVKADEPLLSELKKSAKENGILLGNGYGTWKPYSFRIANFPAIDDKEFATLKDYLVKAVK